MTELLTRRALVLAPLLTAALLGGAVTTSAQATAPTHARVPASTGSVDCRPGQVVGSRTTINRDESLPAGTVSAYESDLGQTLVGKSLVSPRADAADARSLAERAPDTLTAAKAITVKVYAHVIKPRKSKAVLSRAKVRKQVKVMNRAYAGKQSRYAYNTHIHFKLKKIDFSSNKKWYRADLGTKASKAMKKSLHRGGKSDLNIYFSRPKGSFGITLGYSSFPQQYKKHKSQDGVVVHIGSLKGGGITGYNRGDTAVHEVGHWLGLYHTFQGGCGSRNDYVTDTPAESGPNFTCPSGLDTCTAPGLDPIHNFMDYSYDSCMSRFTKGQSERMKLHWLAYRS